MSACADAGLDADCAGDHFFARSRWRHSTRYTRERASGCGTGGGVFGRVIVMAPRHHAITARLDVGARLLVHRAEERARGDQRAAPVLGREVVRRDTPVPANARREMGRRNATRRNTRDYECNGPQWTATECNATQRQRNATQRNATECHAMQCDATRRDAMRCNATNVTPSSTPATLTITIQRGVGWWSTGGNAPLAGPPVDRRSCIHLK